MNNAKDSFKKYTGNLFYFLESLIGKPIIIDSGSFSDAKGILIDIHQLATENEIEDQYLTYSLGIHIPQEYIKIPEDDVDRKNLAKNLQTNSLVPFIPYTNNIREDLPYYKKEELDESTLKKIMNLSINFVEPEDLPFISSCYYCKNFEICKPLQDVKRAIFSFEEDHKQKIYIAMATNCKYKNIQDVNEEIISGFEEE